MRVEDLVKELKIRGYKVEARKRSDGGFIITKINGVKYQGAKGNNVARQALGVKISSKRLEANRTNVQRFIKIPTFTRGARKGEKVRKKNKNILTRKEISRIKKIQYNSRKTKNKTGINPGSISRAQCTQYKKEHGGENLSKLLLQKERYFRGIASESNIKLLAFDLKSLRIEARENGGKLSTQRALGSLVKLLESKRGINNFKEKDLQIVRQAIYDRKNGAINSAEFEKIIREIVKSYFNN